MSHLYSFLFCVLVISKKLACNLFTRCHSIVFHCINMVTFYSKLLFGLYYCSCREIFVQLHLELTLCGPNSFFVVFRDIT